jgi:hypothetical protein
MGVSAEIRTSLTPPIGPDLASSFWVGDNLQNGAFVQFGYDLTVPGSYCLYGEVMGAQGNCLGAWDNVGYGDARWFWEYWPNAAVNDFYYHIGPANSAGANGSWHLYQIWPTSGWSFVMDGKTVSSFKMFQPNKSRDPAYIVAEEISSTQSPSGSLGPVEFRKLSYLDDYMKWETVTSLSAILGCGSPPYCSVTNLYGISMLGPNDIIVGSGEQLTQSGTLLWPQTFTLNLLAPSIVPVMIDGISYLGGITGLPLSQGRHSISVPEFVGVDSGDRLRFESWSDGSTQIDRSVNLTCDSNLTAIYVQQYKLTIVSSFPSSGNGWYDQGTRASFETNTTPQITDTLGLTIFGGWHGENGALITSSGSGSIRMDAPVTLEIYWPVLNYLILIIIAALFVFASLFKVALSGHKSRKEPTQD